MRKSVQLICWFSLFLVTRHLLVDVQHQPPLHKFYFSNSIQFFNFHKFQSNVHSQISTQHFPIHKSIPNHSHQFQSKISKSTKINFNLNFESFHVVLKVSFWVFSKVIDGMFVPVNLDDCMFWWILLARNWKAFSNKHNVWLWFFAFEETIRMFVLLMISFRDNEPGWLSQKHLH